MNQNISGAAGGGIFALGLVLFELVVLVVLIAGLWKIFTKAGKPGWACIIPIYNLWVLLEIVGKPGWWLILYLIPCVNIVVAIMVNVELAKKFGQGVGFAIGLILLPVIFIPLLGFGDFQYQGQASTM